MPAPPVAHHRVDTAYLEALTDDPAAGGLALDAAGWRQAIRHAGLEPVLGGAASADPVLAAEIDALRAALAEAPAAPVPHAALERLAGTASLWVGAAACLFLLATLPSVGLRWLLPHSGALLLLGALAWAAGRWAREDRPGARVDAVPRALRALVRRTRVIPVADGILEICPVAARLRASLGALDDALHDADARLESLHALADEIRSSNLRLGHPADDGETARLAALQAGLRADRAEVRAARDAFLARLDALEGDLARLREIAHRERLSGLVQAAGGAGPAPARAAAEVEGATIDADAARLSGEVHHAAARLRAAVREAALRGPR